MTWLLNDKYEIAVHRWLNMGGSCLAFEIPVQYLHKPIFFPIATATLYLRDFEGLWGTVCKAPTLAERQHVRGVTCCHPPPFPLSDPRSSDILNILGFKQNCPQPFLSTCTTPSGCSQSRGSPVACVGCWLGPCCLEFVAAPSLLARVAQPSQWRGS